MEGKNITVLPEGTYKKVGERDIMDDLHDIAEKEGFDPETTRFIYEKKDGKKVYSIEIEDK